VATNAAIKALIHLADQKGEPNKPPPTTPRVADKQFGLFGLLV
jgi:hypothetical protein